MPTRPTFFFPTATEAAGVLSLPITDLPGLNAGEADEAAGDGRKVCFGLLQAMEQRYAAAPAASRPAGMTIAKGTPTGVNATTIRQTFTVTFDLDITASDLAAEPA